MKKSSGKYALILALAVLLTLASLLIFTPAAANTTVWQLDPDPSWYFGPLGGGDWHDSDNWDNGVPTSTMDAIIDKGGSANISNMEAAARNLTVGDSNKGYVLPNSIIRVKGNLTLGQQAGSLGSWGEPEHASYTLTVGQEGSLDSNMIVGAGGKGSFDLSWGGTTVGLTVYGKVVVGEQAGSVGHFTNYYYSTAYIAGDLILGQEAGSRGYVNHRDLDITVGQDLIVGAAGEGRFETGWGYSDGGLSLTVNGNLIVGDQGGSSGYVMSYLVSNYYIKGDCILGKEAGSSGDFSIYDYMRTFTVGQEGSLGSKLIVGAGGKGSFKGEGLIVVHGDLVAGDQAGSDGYVSVGGADIRGDLILGNQAGAVGFFEANTLSVGQDMVVGVNGQGAFVIDNAAAQVNISRSLTFGENAQFSAEPGATINMTGAHFNNLSTDPDNLSGLESLTLVFTGGSDTDPLSFEVAGQDLGPVMAGYTNNFALDTLQLGDGDQTAYLVLFDKNDNNSSGVLGDEALYVYTLILGVGSTLDLNFFHLYCQSFTNLGGTILNGGIQVVPLPGSVLLLGTGLLGLGLLGWRRKTG
jgi:hypothetical protein